MRGPVDRNETEYQRKPFIFIDSEKDSWNMDPDLLEEAIKDRIAKTGKTPKAIVPVALYGMPYQVDRIMEIADRYGIPVIEDAAEGFGSRWDGQVLGTFGKFGVLSFNGNKMITTSGGGALICEDAADKQKIMWYATQARESYPYYQHELINRRLCGTPRRRVSLIRTTSTKPSAITIGSPISAQVSAAAR